MNPAFHLLYQLMQIIVFAVLLLPTLYIFVFAFAGLFYCQLPYPEKVSTRKIAVLIPAYKEDAVIIEAAKDALTQNYPQDKYDVVIIADSFQPETIDVLKKLPINLIEVDFDTSTKAKALNLAMQKLDGPYDIAVVLDADNIMASDFLAKVNTSFESKCIVFQGHRMAKNTDTPLAILDAISEEVNNHIFRKGCRVLGLSSVLAGSGMAFQYSFFKTMMQSVTAVGGFDKEIELKLLKDNIRIDYLDDAVVYDEKTANSDVFKDQRRRWLAAQSYYFRSSFHSLITTGSIGYFHKMMQFIQPPRVLLLAADFSVGALFLLTNYLFGISSPLSSYWIVLFALCILLFLFSIPLSFYNKHTLKAVTRLPEAFFLVLGSLMKIKGANKQFIHTKHTAVATHLNKNHLINF